MTPKKPGPIGRTFKQENGHVASVTAYAPADTPIVVSLFTAERVVFALSPRDARKLAEALLWACDKIPEVH